jgi:hypothetical protein
MGGWGGKQEKINPRFWKILLLCHIPIIDGDAMFHGWNEPTTTNALVEDEAVHAILGMNQKHILPCLKFLVFSTSFLPQSFSLLPTSLQPTSPFLPTSPNFVFTPLPELKST